MRVLCFWYNNVQIADSAGAVSKIDTPSEGQENAITNEIERQQHDSSGSDNWKPLEAILCFLNISVSNCWEYYAFDIIMVQIAENTIFFVQ